MSVESAGSIQKVDSDDSIVACQRDSADFFDSIGPRLPRSDRTEMGPLTEEHRPRIRAQERWPAWPSLTRKRVRQESWQRIGGASPPRGRSSQPPRPRVMHEVLLARAAVKRSQGRPRAEY